MDKLLYFGHKNQFGEQVITPLTFDASHVKVAADYMPEVQDYIRNLKPESGRTYILVNALGAGEYWGPNSNQDHFSEADLIRNHHTFLEAHPFEHHINKDPKKALGKVEMSVWNPIMHRVELILSIDNEKAPNVVQRIDAGEYPAVSMGAKVAFDVCSVCGHQSKHIREYCEHLKTQGNQILPDGRRVYAINPNPKFFDISFVLIGADKTASVLKKVASADVCAAPQFRKLSAELAEESKQLEPKKTAAEIKRAAIYKDVPAEVSGVIEESGSILDKDILPALESSEPAMPKEAIDKLASFDTAEALSTLTYTGIVLKPVEYQRFVLTKMGHSKIADALDRANLVFDTNVTTDATKTEWIKTAKFSDAAFDVIYPFIGERSAFSPHIEARLEKLAQHEKLGYMAPMIPVPVEMARQENKGQLGLSADLLKLLAVLGLGYAAYRNTVPKADYSKLDQLLSEHPKTTAALLAGVAGSLAIGLSEARSAEPVHPALTKSAGFTSKVLLPFGGAYLGSAYLQGKRNQGYRLNRLETFLADNPMLVGGAGAYLGMRKYLDPAVAKNVAEGVKKVAHSLGAQATIEKRASFGGENILTFASGWLKPTLPNIAGNAIDLAAIGAAIKGAQMLAERKRKQAVPEVLQQIAKGEELRTFSYKPNS